jgi:hemolysin D
MNSLSTSVLMRFEPLRRHLAIWRAALDIEKKRPPSAKLRSEELAFLPAALEIVESPPNPLGTIGLWTIMALIAIGLSWSIVGQLDIHATAQGRIIPGGKTKAVAPSETGSVAEILVNDGQHVEEGQVLVRLDPVAVDSDAAHLGRDRLELLVTIARLRALLDGRSDFTLPKGVAAPEDLLALHRQQLRQKLADHRAAVENLEQERHQKESELHAAEADMVRLQQTVPLLEEQAKAKAELSAQGYVTRTEYLKVQQDFVDRQQALVAAPHKVAEAQSAINGATEKLHQIEAQFRTEALAQLSEAEQKAAGLTQDLAKADDRRRLYDLTAPVAGVVQQLAVHAKGAVVSVAQPVVMIVPDGEGIAVEAELANKDSGFVRPGQNVEIKVESFPFTRYGTIPGEVVHVSGDAVQGSEGEAAQRRAGGGAGTGDSVYSVRIKLLQDKIMADGHEVALTAGMGVTAEIKIGRRRVIEYILDPVMRYREESLRER